MAIAKAHKMTEPQKRVLLVMTTPQSCDGVKPLQRRMRHNDVAISQAVPFFWTGLTISTHEIAIRVAMREHAKGL
jgi:hypothetical protein